MSKLKVRAVNEHSKTENHHHSVTKMVSTVVLEKIQGRTEHYRTKNREAHLIAHWPRQNYVLQQNSSIQSERGAGSTARLCEE